MTTSNRLSRIETRIAAACVRAGRGRESVLLVAVTKTRPLEQVRELLALGPRDFAENRVQDARERIPMMPAGIDWHYIGPLQTNKAKYLPGLFSWVHSVDRIEAADALQRAWEKHPELPALRVLLQFNIAGEEQKHGAGEEEALVLLRHAISLPRLSVEGLMCMAPYDENPENARPVFRGLRLLRDRLQEATGHALPQLSMGMTGDFEVAIEEGSTMVRVGTALFED